MSWDPPLPYALLIQDDVVGHKEGGNNNTDVVKGALLAKLSQEEVRGLKQHQAPGLPPFNFKCLEDHRIKLYCSAHDVQLLNEKQKEFLHGVVKDSDRYDTLAKLEWARKLTKGSTIFVNISAFPTAAKAILHYIGSLPGENGIKFGIELSECKYHGTNNGKFKDTQYFKCENDCGMFVGLDKISERRVTIITKPAGASADSNGTKPLKKQKSEEQKMEFEVGDRVMAFDDNGGTVYGTVKWTGGGSGRFGKIVGIETDVPVDAINFGGHITYIRHYFTPSDNKGREYQLFLPFTCILKTTVEAPVSARQIPTAQLPSAKHVGNNENAPDHTREHQQAPMDSPSGTPLTKKKPSAKLSDRSDHDGDGDKLVTSNSVSEPQFKPSTAKSSEPAKKTPMDSPGGTPLAKKKPVTSLSGQLDHDGDGDALVSVPQPKPSTAKSSEPAKKTSMDSPSNTPPAKTKPPSSQFDHDGGDDKLITSNVAFGPQPKPSSAKSSEPATKPPTDSRSTTPLAAKKPSAKLNSIFDSDEDDDLFRASNVGSKHNLVQQISEDQSVKQSTSSIRLSQSSTGSASRGEANLSEIAQVHKDLQTLENRIGQLGGNCDDINTTVQRLHQSVSEMERKYEKLQTQMSYNQQEMEDSIKRMVANVDNAFRKALDVQKSNEELQESNAHLRNQLSLTQQQLLGVQSMMTCSRLWVVSHDQFKIGKEISRGAWATVHETTFRGATVAAKCLHQLIIAPTTRQLFQREMEMALQCQHQNIVTFLGATLEGPPVILMELMDTSLRNAYEKGNIKDHQVLGIFHDIASALHFLHTRPDPVIHRDVSSANVLLKALYSGEWLAKLGDLGTAKLQRLTTTAGPGAIIYGAPEAGDASKHSPKMDVYSFGVLVVETMTSTLPIGNLDVLKDQVHKQFPWYHQLVTSCTNQQSSDRPTMYDVIKELDKIKKIAKP